MVILSSDCEPLLYAESRTRQFVWIDIPTFKVLILDKYIPLTYGDPTVLFIK